MWRNIITCGGLPPPRRAPAGSIELDTNPNAPGAKRVLLKLDALTEHLLDNVPPVLADALEIASYVFMADRLIVRGTDEMGQMGADWRRSLAFRIPVRRPDVWRDPEIHAALVGALCFLSEDDFEFEFVAGDPATRLDPFLGFNDPEAQKVRPDDIILFSGGLDSLAGTLQQVMGAGRNAVLVTHRSSNNVAGLQEALLSALRARIGPRQLFHAPVRVTKGSYDTPEYTQRTRSFLFVSLGVAIASMFGRHEIQFFENGITSFNLPIAEHVIGTRASRTTHPRVLSDFQRLFSLLTQREIRIENAFLWHTKADVIGVLRKHQCESMLPLSVSCAGVRNWAMSTKQCGVCSQCIERRFAVLANNLREYEPDDTYSINLFTGAHSKPQDIVMAEQHVSRAERLASMSEDTFLVRYGQVFRILPHLPGSPAENAARVHRLHQRYGRELLEVVNGELRGHADFANSQALPSTSLLVMINSALGAGPAFVDPIENEPAAAVQAANTASSARKPNFRFAVDRTEKRVIFEDGPVIRGAGFELIERLASQFEVDRAAGTALNSFGFVTTTSLMQHLKAEEHTVAQRILRVRKELKRGFNAAIDYIPDEQDVIQSRPRSGYRLNPHLALVPPTQIDRAREPRGEEMSGSAGRNVRTRQAGH